MRANPGNYCTLNVVNRISAAGVFGEAVVVVVRNMGYRMKYYILQHRAKANSIPDLRLIFFRELDALGITATLKIKNAGRTPSMLIITDQQALRVSGQRSLACAR